MSHRDHPAVTQSCSPVFGTTLWGVVRLAGGAAGSAASAAQEQLCRAYWYPLYAYARRLGIDAHEAQDVTQEFFSHLLKANLFRSADPALGRFRSFLLSSFRNFAGQRRIRAQATKRGGGCEFVAIDAVEAEQRYQSEPAHCQSADRLFDRRWAMQLLEKVLERLEKEAAQAGRERQFLRLQPFLAGDKQENYAQVSLELGLSEGALRVTVHRLRQRCRELFRDELAQTVASRHDFEEELRHIFAVLSE